MIQLFIWSNVIAPVTLLIVCTSLFLASFGLHIGLGGVYIRGLVKVFEFCRTAIEKKNRHNQLKRLSCFDLNPPESNGIIEHEDTHVSPLDAVKDDKEEGQFEFGDTMTFIKNGVQAIVEDEVTKRFASDELSTWNLMTRTNRNYQFINWKLTLIWFVGWVVRFCVLFPIRLIIMVYSLLYLIITMALVGLLPESRLKRVIYRTFSIISFRIMARCFSSTVTYHNEENRPQSKGICVANHTSPIDVVILHCDEAYALVGQLQGGFLGILERALSRATSHVFFDRFETKDRTAVTTKLKEHVEDPDKLPILIFPEGTCINNSAVMQFKKGSFEVGGTIYPVAIKYDTRFGEPFWDSSKYGYFTHMLMMMTSWAIVCEVWYLPPMVKSDAESSIDFANRVKAIIAAKGGLVDLQWDGQLKRQKVRPEWRAEIQKIYSHKISASSI